MSLLSLITSLTRKIAQENPPPDPSVIPMYPFSCYGTSDRSVFAKLHALFQFISHHRVQINPNRSTFFPLAFSKNSSTSQPIEFRSCSIESDCTSCLLVSVSRNPFKFSQGILRHQLWMEKARVLSDNSAVRFPDAMNPYMRHRMTKRSIPCGKK
jgi:hypothetical protein